MVVRARWRAAPAVRRWLPWLVPGALLALAAWYAVASDFFTPVVPLSWRTRCDICGVYIAEDAAACERFFIDSDRAVDARVNARGQAQVEVAEDAALSPRPMAK